jgi:hypothetical protein
LKILAIDPGTVKSAFLVLETSRERLCGFGIIENENLIEKINFLTADFLVIEKMKSYGNVIGDSVLETCVWIGRFIERWKGDYYLVTRKEVVLHHCGHARAKDKNVRQAILDRFGGAAIAKGKKINQGPLYGVSRDVWSALAIALMFCDSVGDLVH